MASQNTYTNFATHPVTGQSPKFVYVYVFFLSLTHSETIILCIGLRCDHLKEFWGIHYVKSPPEGQSEFQVIIFFPRRGKCGEIFGGLGSDKV